MAFARWGQVVARAADRSAGLAAETMKRLAMISPAIESE
jgi:hypothetical protein